MACRSGLGRCSCTGRGNGARWLACQPYEQLGTRPLRRLVCPIRAEATCSAAISSRRWSATGSSIQAANGVCTGCGSSKAPWAICSAKILRWSRKTRSIVASTSLSSTSRRCSRICVDAGRICSAPLRGPSRRFDQHVLRSDPPGDDSAKRRHGYSRDERSDCVQVVIALVVTPEAFRSPSIPNASTRRRCFLSRSRRSTPRPRIWVMDRGIPTAPRCGIRSARRLSGGNSRGTPRQAGMSLSRTTTFRVRPEGRASPARACDEARRRPRQVARSLRLLDYGRPAHRRFINRKPLAPTARARSRRVVAAIWPADLHQWSSASRRFVSRLLPARHPAHQAPPMAVTARAPSDARSTSPPPRECRAAPAVHHPQHAM